MNETAQPAVQSQATDPRTHLFVALAWSTTGFAAVALLSLVFEGAAYTCQGRERNQTKGRSKNTATAAVGVRWSEGVGMRPGAVSAGNEGRA